MWNWRTQGIEFLCTAPKGLSTQDVHFCFVTRYICKVHRCWICLCHGWVDSGLEESAWTTPQALRAVSRSLGWVLSQDWYAWGPSTWPTTCTSSLALHAFQNGKCSRVAAVRAGLSLLSLPASKHEHMYPRREQAPPVLLLSQWISQQAGGVSPGQGPFLLHMSLQVVPDHPDAFFFFFFKPTWLSGDLSCILVVFGIFWLFPFVSCENFSTYRYIFLVYLWGK